MTFGTTTDIVSMHLPETRPIIPTRVISIWFPPLFFFQQWVTCFKAGAIIVFQYFLLSLLHHYLQNHFFMIQVEAI